MTCQEALALLYDVIDNEAADIDLKQVREHLSHCHDCSEVYRVEQAIDKLMKAKLAGTESSDSVAGLKANVLTALDELDTGHSCAMEKKSPDPTFLSEAPDRTASREPVYTPQHNKVFSLGRVMAIAASLVVIVGATYFGSTLIEHEEHYSKLEVMHVQAVSQLNAFVNADVTNSVQSKVNFELGYEIQNVVADFEMVGAQYDNVDGIDVAHFLYQDGDRVVSVYVARQGEIEIPSDLLEHPVVHNQIQFYDHHCRGCRLVYHTVGDLIVVTATKERDIDLLSFVPGRMTA